MATFKNIRIGMKGGKSRLQRVKVLASGKYKFVKNLTKKVTRRAKRKSNPGRKRGVKRMGKKRRRGGKSMTRTAFKLIRLGALVAPAAHVLMTHRTTVDKINGLALRYFGFSTKTGEFHPEFLAQGWGPYILANLATHGIPKLTSIIRRL